MSNNTLPKIVAIDFDGTLVMDQYPMIGLPYNDLFDLCKKLRTLGVKVILWTCRTDEQLKDAVEFCAANGLEFDAVNKNIPEVQELYGGDTRKVFADVYIDDKTVPSFQHPLYWIEKLGLKLDVFGEPHHK